MAKTALSRRRNEYGTSALATRIAALGLLDDHLKEAILVHVDIMRNAVNRLGIDYAARQRSADALLALGGVVAGMGRGDTDRTPLLSMTFVGAPPVVVPRSIEVLDIVAQPIEVDATTP